jgi:dTDP-glucose 4,6-dehydratase
VFVKLFVTGGAGFIGSNFIRYLLGRHEDVEVLNFDKLTYAGNLENLTDVVGDPRYAFVRGDISDSAALNELLDSSFDAVINFAAESHVDRSIEDASPFLHTNVVGTQALLEAVRQHRLPLFVQISTDEVYGGAARDQSFQEDDALNPKSPYAATKAAADHLVNAHTNSYRLPVLILRCTNNYGPYQFPEKLIPLTIVNALEHKPVPIYGDGLQERDWLYVEDFCRAIEQGLEQGKTGETYNVSSGARRTNLEVVRAILKLLGKPESLIKFVEDRPGHDRRYALNNEKIRRSLGWKPQVSFEEGISRTIEWCQRNTLWLERARSEEYRRYYDRHYTRRPETLKSILK